MKGPFERTKVVLRRLHPAISQTALMEQIDATFAGRYNWVCFRPGKNSQKNPRYSRAYIDLKKPEDVVEFAEYFGGHTVVNEKGAQFKVLVEYAPSQRVPKAPKKDGREGTILKDPEYLEFLEHLAKPVENLPSAEIQLERREAERAGAPKEALVVTPLMEYIRQRRAAKNGSQRANGKISRRHGGAPGSSSPSRRASDKQRVQNSMYVLRDGTKNNRGKEKSTRILVPKRDEHLLLDKTSASPSLTDNLEDGNVPGGIETGNRRVVLLKGKEKEISHVSSGSSQQQNVTSVRNPHSSYALKQNQRNDASGRIIRSILSNKDTRQIQLDLASSQSDQQTTAPLLDKDKRPPRPPNVRPILKDLATGSYRHVGRRGSLHGQKEVDGAPNFPEGKPSKRGGSSGYGSHERQVWVQKSGSG